MISLRYYAFNRKSNAVLSLLSVISSKSRILLNSLFKSFQPNSIGFKSGE